MTVYNQNITWPGTSGSNNKKKNPSTPILTEQNTYGDYFNSLGNTSTPTISDPNIKPAASSGNIGNTYGDILTPNELTAPTTPIYTPVFGGENSLVGNSVVGGGSAIGGNLVKPVDPSQYFDGGVVGTVGGGFSGGNKGGVSDEGIIAENPKVDNSTFNTNVGNGGSVAVSPTVSKKPETQQNIPNSGNEITTGNTGTKVDTNVSVNESTGVVEQKPVTAPTTPTTTPTTDAKTEETPVMTYEEYIAEQKAIEEEKRKAALKQAQVYKERAAADAQASYMQNMSAYGVNAENMAKMGLTGGGYSDYLNAQAYAQKRDDMQVASATELAMKQQAETTYADGIAALNKEKFAYQQSEKQNKTNAYNSLLGYAMDANSGLTEESIRSMAKNIGLSEEEIQSIINTMNTAQSTAKNEYANNALTALIADLQNPNAYGNYSEAGIRALGKQWGWTDEQIQQAVDIWNDTKKGAEVSLDGESEDTSQYSASAVIDGVRNGTYDNYSREGLHELCLQYRNKGYMTDTEVKQVMDEYDRRYAYAEGKISTDEYYNAANGDQVAQEVVGNVLNYDTFNSESKDRANKIMNSMISKYGITEVGIGVFGKTIDIKREPFDVIQLGDFKDNDDPNSGQGKYTQALLKDEKSGKIKEGQLVRFNYGNVNGDTGTYVYIGNGVFVSITDGSTVAQINGRNYYIPDGYCWKNGKVEKK